MAKGIYFGVGGAARKVSKLYFGVDGVARKVKKVYFGVGGLPRLAYSVEPGKRAITQLTTARDYHCAVSNPSYALFAGGSTTSGVLTNTVEAYNSTLVKSTSSAILAAPIGSAAGASIGAYALIFGGINSSNNAVYYVHFIDTNLIRTLKDDLLNNAWGMYGASNTNYAIGAGGSISSAIRRNITGWDATLTRVTGLLGTQAREGACVSTPARAIFGGGTGAVEAVNNSFQVSVLTPLSPNRFYLSAAKAGNYALFAGGYVASNVATVDYYDANAVHGSGPDLQSARRDMASASLGDYAIFACGSLAGTDVSSDVDCYDTYLVRSSLQNVDVSRYYAKGVTIGDYAIFAGGSLPNVGTKFTAVDAYSL